MRTKVRKKIIIDNIQVKISNLQVKIVAQK
jgi:hypothetical protein